MLTWGVTAEAEGIDVNTVGVILLVVGILSLLLTLLFWSSWWGPGYWRRGGAYAERDVAVRRGYGARRATVVEEDVATEAPPPGPPPP